MNKLDANFPVYTLSLSSHSDPVTGRCLIVLVPEIEADTSSMAREIWELANVLGCRVQFLGLCKDEAHEPSLRRQIIAMSSVVGGESKIEFGANWLEFVKSNWREGDIIVCFAEHRAGIANRPMSQILESSLNATVYVLAGFHRQEERSRGWMFNAVMWVGSIGIILGFFWLQSRLVQSPRDWVYTTLLYISIFVEAGSIWAWNSLFG